MEKISFFFKKEFMGLILTLAAMVLTIVALISYIHNPLLSPSAMAALIAPIGAGGLLFYGIRSTEGYFLNALNTNTQQVNQTTEIKTTTNDQPDRSVK